MRKTIKFHSFGCVNAKLIQQMNAKVSKEEFFILQKLIEGDEDAFKYFFDTYYDDLCNFVFGYIRDEALAEDIVQGIFIDLWNKKSSLYQNQSIKSYLYSASKNKSLNYLRDTKNQDRIIRELLPNLKLTSDAADQYLEFEELKELITDAVENLPPQCKNVYQLSRDEAMTNREIAENMGISLKTVENQMTIAIKKIKEFLHPYQDQIFIFFLLINFF